MSEIIKVNLDTLDEVVLKAAGPVILAIGAPWCPDCVRAAPFFAAMAKTFEGRLTFAGANADECPGIRERFGVRHIPTMIIFRDGKPVGEGLVEVKSPSELKAFIEAGLKACEG